MNENGWDQIDRDEFLDLAREGDFDPFFFIEIETLDLEVLTLKNTCDVFVVFWFLRDGIFNIFVKSFETFHGTIKELEDVVRKEVYELV